MKSKEQIILNGEKRELGLKSLTKKYRKEGYVPFVIYGPDLKDNVFGIVKENDVIKILKEHGESSKIRINIDKKSYDVFIKDFDYNNLKGRLLHLDFYRISEKHAVKVEVPIIFEGVSLGEKAGGIVEKFLHHIEVEGLVSDIPENIKISMENYNVGAKLHVGDLKVSDKIKILMPKDEVIFVIKVHVEEAAPSISTPEATAEEVSKAAEIFD